MKPIKCIECKETIKPGEHYIEYNGMIFDEQCFWDMCVKILDAKEKIA